MSATPDTTPVSESAARLARKAADALERVGPALWFGLIPVGLYLTFLMLPAPFFGMGVILLIAFGGGVLFGVLLRQLLPGLSALLRVNADQAEAIERLEQRLCERLERVAAAVEAAAERGPSTATASAELRAQHVVEIRHAIRTGAWSDAEALLGDFAEAHPGDHDTARLNDELARTRQAAREEALARLDAARAANDPERVIALRDELKLLLEPDALRPLDRDLAKWFIMLIQRRLRAGTVRPDVAALAARVAVSLDETPEGASLRASLPTLRRAAGLCARCAQPYTGIAEACPTCLSTANTIVAPMAPPTTDGPDRSEPAIES